MLDEKLEFSQQIFQFLLSESPINTSSKIVKIYLNTSHGSL